VASLVVLWLPSEPMKSYPTLMSSSSDGAGEKDESANAYVARPIAGGGAGADAGAGWRATGAGDWTGGLVAGGKLT
jgi:hypothetical protein